MYIVHIYIYIYMFRHTGIYTRPLSAYNISSVHERGYHIFMLKNRKENMKHTKKNNNNHNPFMENIIKLAI